MLHVVALGRGKNRRLYRLRLLKATTSLAVGVGLLLRVVRAFDLVAVIFAAVLVVLMPR